jgi:hypothetical protein
MHGFLAPVKADIFAYYWNLGFYKEVLFHLMVLKVQVTVAHGACGKSSGTKLVDEYIFHNNHERGDTEPVEPQRFAEWVSYFLETEPHFVEGQLESLGPPLEEGKAIDALISGLKEGLTLSQVGGKFQFQRLAPPPARLKLDRQPSVSKGIYVQTTARKGDGAEFYQHEEPDSPTGQFRDSVQVETDAGPVCMTITLFLRSPEGILYYLGELARLEEKNNKVPHICVDGKLEPLFVVHRSSSECSKAVEVTNGDGATYAIPARNDKIDKPNCTKSEFRKLSSCDPGRSMEALTVVSQLIALQKSAKDLPTTSVVRVVGQ